MHKVTCDLNYVSIYLSSCNCMHACMQQLIMYIGEGQYFFWSELGWNNVVLFFMKHTDQAGCVHRERILISMLIETMLPASVLCVTVFVRLICDCRVFKLNNTKPKLVSPNKGPFIYHINRLGTFFDPTNHFLTM